MRALLREVAERILSPGNSAAFKDKVTEAMTMQVRLLTFLQNGFRHHVRPDFDAFMKAEKEKSPLDGTQTTAERQARYLCALAGRLTFQDIDPGFLLPHTFDQYGAFQWPANTAPKD